MKSKHLATLLIIITIAMIPAVIFAAGTGVYFDEETVSVKTFQEFKRALEDPQINAVILDKNIKDDNKKNVLSDDSVPEIDVIVSGNKQLDLNGHKIVYDSYKDYTQYMSEDYVSGSESYFIDIPENSSLTIIDSKSKGSIEYGGFFIKKSDHHIYKASVHRNIFCVEGSLNIYGGSFKAGNARKQLISASLTDASGNLSKLKLSLVNQVVFGTCISLFDNGRFNCYGGYFISNGFDKQWKESCIYIGSDAVANIYDGSFTADFGSAIFVYSDNSSLKICTGSFLNSKLKKIRISDDIEDEKIKSVFIDNYSNNVIFSNSLLADPSAVVCLSDNGRIDNYESLNSLSVVPVSGPCVLTNSNSTDSAVVYNGERAKYLVLNDYSGLIGQNIHLEYILQQYDNNGHWNTVIPWTTVESCTDGKIFIEDLYSDWVEKTKYRVSVRIYENFDGYNNTYSTVRQSNYLTILSGFDVILTKGECNHNWEEIADSATCISDGEKIFTCNLCGQIKSEHSPRNNEHVVSSVFDKTKTNCYKKCIVCGQILENHVHSYVQYSENSDYLSHTIYRRCIYCGDIKKEIIINNSMQNSNSICKHNDQLSKEELNDYDNYVVCSSTNSDCKYHGHISCRICKNCGDIFSLDGIAIDLSDVFSVPLASHVFSDYCDPTCNSCGYTRDIPHYFSQNLSYSKSVHFNKCNVCGYTDNVCQHNFEFSIKKQPLCEASGTAFLSCACNDTVLITLPAKGHQLMHIIEEPGSCSNPESADYYKCIDCNKLFYDQNAERQIESNTVIIGDYNSDVHIGGHLHADSKFHWEQCSCGEVINKQKHRFVDKICVDCGYFKGQENLR